MITYIVLFVFVLFLSRVIEKNKNNKFGYIFATIFIIVLSTVAGVRSIEMGWDAQKYVISTFFRLNYFNGELRPFLNATTVEIGFSVYSFILYKLCSDINFLMFGYSFLTTLLVTMFAFREKDNIPISKVLIVYYFTLYLISFNIIRQSISTLIILLSVSFYKDKKIISAFLLYIVAILFHNSAVLAIPIYVLFSILKNGDSNSAKIKKGLFVVICVLIICSIYEKLALSLYQAGIISQKYYSYMIEYDRIDYNLSNILINAYWLVFGLLFLKVGTNTKRFNNLIFSVVMLFISLVINIISIKIHPIYRIGYYYYYVGMFNLVPVFSTYVKKDSTNYKLGNYVVYVALILMFLWMTILGNGHNIYPYHSDIIQWLK